MAKLGITTGTIPDDGTGDSLLAGAIKINSNFNEIYEYFGDGSDLSFESRVWGSTSAGISTVSNTGIGTTNPRFALEVGYVGSSGTSLYVNSDARITGVLAVGSSSITLDGSSDILTVGSGVTIYGSSGIVSATSVYVNGSPISAINSPYADTSGIATYASIAGIATYATSSGIATYASIAGIATYATSSGIATYASSAGIATYASSAGLSTYASIAGIATYASIAGIATYATSSGIATYASIAGIATYATSSGIATYASVAGISTLAEGIFGTPDISVGTVNALKFIGIGSDIVGIVTGIVAGSGILVNNTTGRVTVSISSIGLSYWEKTVSGINTADSVGIGTTNPTSKLTVIGDALITGVVTALSFVGDIDGHSTSSGIASYADYSGISTYASSSGISTVSEGLTGTPNLVVGIITATNFVGDGSGLINVIGSGSGVIVEDDGSPIGTAGTINFGTGLSVSPISAGIVTVTATATGSGESYWIQTDVGIHTLSNVGVGTTAKSGFALDTLGPVRVQQSDNTVIVSSGGLTIDGAEGREIQLAYHTNSNYILNNIGIGTTNPGEKLQVDGNIRVGISTTSNYIAFRGTYLDGPANTGGELPYQHTYIGERIYDYSGNGERSELLLFKGNDVVDGISGPDRIRLFAGEHRFDVLGFSTSGTFEQVGLSTAAVNKLTINSIGVGIGTTNPTSALTVVGSGTSTSQLYVSGVSTFNGIVEIDRYGIKTGFGTFIASAGIAHTIDSFTISATDYKTTEYTLHIGFGTYIQAQKVLVMQNGSNAYSQEYGIMYEPDLVVSVGATVSGGELRLEITPESGVTGLSTYRFTRQSML